METYHVACHCQSHVLRYTVPADEAFTDNGVCDCSHCLKRRAVWILAPSGALEVVRGVNGTGEGGKKLSGYSFGAKQSVHQFCGECGTHMLGGPLDKDQPTMFNARAIRDAHFDLWKKPLKVYSGLDRPPQYTHTKLSDLPGAEEYLTARAKELDHPTEIRVGSCHCQAIKFAVACKPLEKIGMCDCACSICLGNGALWIYPKRRDTFFYPSASPTETYMPPSDLLVEYGFSDRANLHYTCKTCGCQIYEYRARVKPDPSGQVEEHDGSNGQIGLNAALFSDAIDYFGDVQGLKEGEGHRGKRLTGLERDETWKFFEPRYKLRL